MNPTIKKPLQKLHRHNPSLPSGARPSNTWQTLAPHQRRSRAAVAAAPACLRHAPFVPKYRGYRFALMWDLNQRHLSVHARVPYFSAASFSASGVTANAWRLTVHPSRAANAAANPSGSSTVWTLP